MALYLAGQHIALIVNRQGRVTTSSSAPFMLRNVAALLPPDILQPPDGDEDIGKPMDIRAMTGPEQAGQWQIDGHLYLLRRQPLSDRTYQLLTLVSLDSLAPMRRQHFWVAGLVAALGLVLILLSGRVAGQMVLRRQEERYAANYDALTGLPNRRAILADLGQCFALAKRTRQSILVAFIDLDEFKTINDTYGHEIGDKFLVEVARRLSAGLHPGDVPGRWGGDEFIVIRLAAPSRPDAPDEAAAVSRSADVCGQAGTAGAAPARDAAPLREIGASRPYCGPSFSTRERRLCFSSAVRSLSGERTGPAPRPMISAPALTMLTA
ncbi:MAG: diguanylate cyclase [Acetobacteraceae bacterium]|nr:diguanylate cyclase [Acetobacteraceae bacterium]